MEAAMTQETWMLAHMMNGIPEDQILAYRKRVQDIFVSKMVESGYKITFIDNYDHSKILPKNASRIEHLGASVQMMADVNHVLFGHRWYDSKGCWVELEVCRRYGISHVFLPDTFGSDIFVPNSTK